MRGICNEEGEGGKQEQHKEEMGSCYQSGGCRETVERGGPRVSVVVFSRQIYRKCEVYRLGVGSPGTFRGKRCWDLCVGSGESHVHDAAGTCPWRLLSIGCGWVSAEAG